MVRNKLMGSKADKAIYDFANSAELTTKEERSILNEGLTLGKIVEKGVHISFHYVGGQKPTSAFLGVEDALKLFLGLRDSLRHVVTEMNEHDKLHLKVLADRDAWAIRIYGKRKSNVAEDLGL